MDKKGTRQLSGCVIILFGINFVLASIGVILTLVFGGNLQEYFTDKDGESNFWWFKTMFWILLIAFAAFLIAGGKFSNFKFPEGYVDDEDEKK